MSTLIQQQRDNNLKILSGVQELTLGAIEIFKNYQKTRVGNKDVLKTNFEFLKAYAKARQAQTAEMQAAALIIEKTVQRGDYSREGAVKDYSELGVIDSNFLTTKQPKQIGSKAS